MPSYFSATRAAYGPISMLERRGDTRQDSGRCAYRQTVSSQHAIGYLGQRGIAVHDVAQAHFGDAVHRFPAAIDHELSAKDISRRGWLAGAQSQVGAALFGRHERPP